MHTKQQWASVLMMRLIFTEEMKEMGSCLLYLGFLLVLLRVSCLDRCYSHYIPLLSAKSFKAMVSTLHHLMLMIVNSIFHLLQMTH